MTISMSLTSSISRITSGLVFFLLSACSSPAQLAVSPSPVAAIVTATSPAASPTATASPTPAPWLRVTILYPTGTTELETGQSIRPIARVTDGNGQPIRDVKVQVTVSNPTGERAATLPALPYTEDTFRAEPFVIPARNLPGEWQVQVVASLGSGSVVAQARFNVRGSTSQVLLQKYGFWIDAPTLRGISPTIAAERGDVRDGMVRWGGQIASMHVLPSNWIDINWRTGNFNLDSPAAVRRFMFEQIGELGFSRVREIGAMERVRFKQWDAWRVHGRGEVRQDQVEWLIFYAPEVDKTYALGTVVVQPPASMDPHAVLRDSFEIDARAKPNGVAPEPLPRLLPRPELVSPPVGERFEGTAQPVVLEWKPVRPLAPDEFYAVTVDYNYSETNTTVRFTTRETRLILPEDLYRTPNCRVFNWQVALERKTGTDKKGEFEGIPLSFSSLLGYVMWSYPVSAPALFILLCPNAQY